MTQIATNMRTLAVALALALAPGCASDGPEDLGKRGSAGGASASGGQGGALPVPTSSAGAAAGVPSAMPTVDAAPSGPMCTPPEAASAACRACLCETCPEAASACDERCWELTACILAKCGPVASARCAYTACGYDGEPAFPAGFNNCARAYCRDECMPSVDAGGGSSLPSDGGEKVPDSGNVTLPDSSVSSDAG
jgi:hypothetical protein